MIENMNIELPEHIVTITRIMSDDSLSREEKTERLIACFAGEYLYFSQKLLKKIRNRQIVEDFYNRRLSIGKIANKYWISKRRVHFILQQERLEHGKGA